jgi:hypothetical protein
MACLLLEFFFARTFSGRDVFVYGAICGRGH